MSKKKLGIVGGVLLLLVLGTALAAGAHPHKAKKQKTPCTEAARGWERLGLEEAQKDELRAIRLAAKRENVLRRGRMSDLKARIRAEFMTESVDKAAVRSLAAELGEVQAEASKAGLETKMTMLDVLTEEQRAQLLEMQAGHRFQKDNRAKRQGRRHRR
jgi:Spy/CpxP family protein refolding chaperone